MFLFCSAIIAFSQNELLVRSNDKGLYLKHTVAAKENFFSIGRLYNVPAKDIAAYNSIDMNHGLAIGQEINIPLHAANFTQSEKKGRPVYYVVGEKEGLYRVSVKHNKVLMANLRSWNHLADDNITSGKKLIVGYLNSTEANSIVQKPLQPVEKKSAAEIKKDVVVTDLPKEKKEETTAQITEKKVDPSVRKAPVTPDPQVGGANGGAGYFKPLFETQIKTQSAKKEQTATAGIFKTASGWQDAKYYALLDGVEAGTIVRIVNPANNKAVYAKVLGEMSGIRQNQGYDIRMSNAAASALEVTDAEKFIVRVNY